MKPTTQIDIKGCDWDFVARGELLMYASSVPGNITIICGADRDYATIMDVKKQRFDCVASFMDACANCGKRGVTDQHDCKAAA